MKIELSDIQKISDIILNQAQLVNISRVEVDFDYYWSIVLEDICAESKPTALVGSLVCDWEWLLKVLCKENISTTIDFHRLGNIFSAVGNVLAEKPNNQNSKDKNVLIVELDVIKTLCVMLFKKMAESGFESVHIEKHHYWYIPKQDIYDLYKDPQIIKKSLSDLWISLAALLGDPKQAGINHLEQFGIMIKYLGEVIEKSEKKMSWLLNIK